MFDTIMTKLRAPANSAADYAAKVSDIDAALPAAEAAVRAAEQRRSAGLLKLDDRALERIEADMAKARRDRDRLLAARDEAERRHAEAAEDEARKPVEDAIAAAEKRAAAFAAGFLKRHDAAAGPLAVLMQEFADIERQVAEANSGSLEFHVQRGTAVSAPAPVRTVTDRISAPHLTATKIMPGDTQPGFGLVRQ